MQHHEQTSVVICGAGPTGVVLSALLSQLKVPNVILEREAEVVTDPRGIALDEDGIRVLQAVGVYDKIFTEIGQCMGKFQFITGTQCDLHKRPLLVMDYSTSEGGSGHVGAICHKQPVLEQSVRNVISKSTYSELRTQCTVTSITESDNHVWVSYSDAGGSVQRIRASLLVGADGKTGYVRKKYLEPKGVFMERCEGMNYEETWVALNWKLSLPIAETHPDLPFWKLGYTPEEVYDLFFPKEFRFLCNPLRPAVCGRFGRPNDRLWRFEFVVREGEDGTKMSTYEETRKVILPYLTHPGSRYGITGEISYPEDCITTLRSRPFGFSARCCNYWSLGRVAIIGDAAHVFPPFGGQGIASGMRDALSLAWRLALIHRQPDIKHQELLKAWYMERKQQLQRSLAATITNGAYVNERNAMKLLWRQWSLYFIQLVPQWRREIEKGQRADGMTQYRYEDGMPFRKDMLGGRQLPQVYISLLQKHRVLFSDDIIFTPSKSSIIQLVISADSVDDLATQLNVLGSLTKDELTELLIREATVLVQDTTPVVLDTSLLRSEVYRLATAQEFAADHILCKNRPPPINYDPYRLRQEVKGRPLLLVRPDRFVYAACSTAEELNDALTTLRKDIYL